MVEERRAMQIRSLLFLGENFWFWFNCNGGVVTVEPTHFGKIQVEQVWSEKSSQKGGKSERD